MSVSSPPRLPIVISDRHSMRSAREKALKVSKADKIHGSIDFVYVKYQWKGKLCIEFYSLWILSVSVSLGVNNKAARRSKLNDFLQR